MACWFSVVINPLTCVVRVSRKASSSLRSFSIVKEMYGSIELRTSLNACYVTAFFLDDTDGKGVVYLAFPYSWWRKLFK